jgi:hypothetical protein
VTDAFPATATLLERAGTAKADGGVRTQVLGSVGWVAVAAGILVLLLLAGLLWLFAARRRSRISTVADTDAGDSFTEEIDSAGNVDEDEFATELDYENPLASEDEFGSEWIIPSDSLELTDDQEETLLL